MKIYQIHVVSMACDNYSDSVSKTFLNKESAELRLQELNNRLANEEASRDFCRKCPLNSWDSERYDTPIERKNAALQYCPHSDIIYNDEYDEYVCNNEKEEEYDRRSHYIKEETVLDG